MYYKVKVNLKNGNSFFLKDKFKRDIKFDHPDTTKAYLDKFGQLHLIKDDGMVMNPCEYKFEIKEYKGDFTITDRKNLRSHLNHLLCFLKGAVIN